MTTPQLTVALVVHNGEKHLGDAIQSFLTQTFRNFQLFVYDNASTDATRQIAEAFAATDERIRIVTHPANIGALRNFVQAADQAHTSYFCWAAHDDVRHPDFLQSLMMLLHHNPSAGLAMCGMRQMAPNGVIRATCTKTQSIKTTIGMNAVRRLQHFLDYAPCSPIYGVFRTEALRTALETLRSKPDQSHFGIDLVFLAHFFSMHEVVVHQEPLLMLRDGGDSHRSENRNGVGALLRDYVTFMSRLRAATSQFRGMQRVRIALVRWRYLMRLFFSKPFRQLFIDRLQVSMPWMARVLAGSSSLAAPFAELRCRVRRRPTPARIVIFGGGKHTRRNLSFIARALRPHATIAAICDDDAAQLEPIEHYPIIPPSQLVEYKPDVLLVSSDSYEDILFDRARTLANGSCEVWRLYDQHN